MAFVIPLLACHLSFQCSELTGDFFHFLMGAQVDVQFFIHAVYEWKNAVFYCLCQYGQNFINARYGFVDNINRSYCTFYNLG